MKESLQGKDLSKFRERIEYASEADVINLAVFGMKASTWKTNHPGWKGNMRDYATVRDLVILQNIEALSAAYISQGYSKIERFEMLKNEADRQRESLKDDVPSIERLRNIIESTEEIRETNRPEIENDGGNNDAK